MSGPNGVSFQLATSAKGIPTVKVVESGGLVSAQYEFRSEAEALAWLRSQEASGMSDRARYHPLEGPFGTD
jgi:hypothetical protein